MLIGEEYRQGYYLFEFETILTVRNKKTNDFRSFRKIPYEELEEANRPDKACKKEANSLK